MDEMWKAVVGYEQVYEVSSYGRLRRSASSSGRPFKILRCSMNREGYARSYLSREGDRTYFRLHQLVLRAFHGPPPVDGQVWEGNHKNGDKMDNRPANLEWVTHSENQLHAYRDLERLNWHTGRTGRGPKLTDVEVRAIRILYGRGVVTQIRLAAWFHVSRTHISSIISRRLRSNVA